jgi:hypothetical protein
MDLNLYTRENANKVDLNRFSRSDTTREQGLRTTYELFMPDYCYNLHDQRTILALQIV